MSVDQSQLRELLGDAELRELLDQDAMDAIERQLQRLDPQYQAKSADAVHDMLLSLGDLTELEIGARAISADVAASVGALVAARRVVPVRIGGDARYIAVEDAARFRDALGVPLPPGIPESLLQPVRDPLGDLALRFARTHAPFSAPDFAARYGLHVAAAEAVLLRLTGEGRLVEGEVRPAGTRREWTDAGVLRMLRRRSLAKLRHEIEPVDQAVLGRFTTTWQGIVKRRHGADALLDAIEQLQGAPLPASILELEILPARLDLYDPADLDAVTAAGEVVWIGVEPLGERDGRVALYLADHLPRLLAPTVRLQPDPTETTVRLQAGRTEATDRDRPERDTAIIKALRSNGASFFGPLHEAVGGGYPGETVEALWNLVWQGLVTNDTFHALRAFTRARAPRRRMKLRRDDVSAFRSRRLAPPSAEGRWALVPRGRESAAVAAPAGRPQKRHSTADPTKWAAALTQQLLARHGVLTREAVASEAIPGGFGLIYPVLKGLEDNGRIRRGYFVAGLGATQFAMPGALDLLRSMRDAPDEPEVAVLAATDPANPYGATLKWPARGSPPAAESSRKEKRSADSAGSALTVVDAGRGPTRSVGATVILVNGALAAYLARGDRQLTTFLPESEPDRSKVGRAVARVLIDRARSGGDAPRGMLIEEIDGTTPSQHPFSQYLAGAGFVAGAMGFQATFKRS